MADQYSRGLCATLLAAMLALLSACASQSKKQEADLSLLTDWLPGRYGSDTGVELAIVRVRIPRIGDHVFYVQEMATDDERRVMAQRLWSLEVAPDGKGLVQRMWSLAEPNRWRQGVVNPDLFVSVMPQDFTQLSGCDLIWTRDGERFTGTNNSATCRVSSPASGSQVRWSFRTELGPVDFATADQAFDMAGKLVQGRADDPFYRFQKR